ncbi:prepilin-type N-terminal cleavage/methylation domain-containing protein [Macrococcoides bohemicum]|uniref:ComG operon protein 3 n=2 Tax=Macrococcoides bohemicum TaxID=1903056 RepID=A0AAE7Q2Z4_9STAP|nr:MULTISPECIES: competence type IV pilus major pilin ComGC [Macrococcus]ATD30216.1 competence protein ComGC [Macrococcus sp. IME1552]MBC9873214.1 prepilin-type N-terminal cleavage/methylation domain-containing protein [Macrococcus bohemicus]QRN50075.1 prepilin-type N-terminal cleavage/methylation domain-containing protein [Macrococcus bohemicus]QYA41511.1 prepilin-type N-terminal cleavage/methylation domain-containing protein [Macrococcus bohemicus]QYA43936.1 prepilin-type N-terminal cleavage
MYQFIKTHSNNFARTFKNQFRKNDGFTLIEMLLVLLVISVLIIVIIPNIAKQSDNVQNTGCTAQVKMVQGQIEAYKLQNGKAPTSINELVPEFLKENQVKCKNGDPINIENGEAVAQKQ